MNKKIWLLICLSVFTLVFIAGLTFFIKTKVDLRRSPLEILSSIFPRGKPGKNTEPSWKVYVDMEHGFSLETPSEWQGKPWQMEFHEIQERFDIWIQPLNPCISSSEYLKNRFNSSALPEIEPLENNRLDGFVVKNFHLDSATPGPETLIFNCPYLIRLGFNPNSFPNPEGIFEHIVSSVKVWPPPAQPTDTAIKGL